MVNDPSSLQSTTLRRHGRPDRPSWRRNRFPVKLGMTGLVTREPARNTRRAGHSRFGNKAPPPLNTKRGGYGQPFSGSHGGSQKMPAVASHPGDLARGEHDRLPLWTWSTPWSVAHLAVFVKWLIINEKRKLLPSIWHGANVEKY